MKRDIQGKFTLKNDDYRSVRSLRLTDSTWEALGGAAESLGITKADLLEQIVRSNDSSSPGITRLPEVIRPSNTREGDHRQPCITWQQEEIERLKAEVQRLREENALLVERNRENILAPSLENLRERVLSSLKLGKQAPGYKAAQKALERLSAELTHPK